MSRCGNVQPFIHRMSDGSKSLDAYRSEFSCSFKELKYLIIGYKPIQKQYFDLNLILSIIGYSIFKGYCISENRKKYIDLLYLTKAEFLKISEIVMLLKFKHSKLLSKFVDYFVHGKQ